MHSSKPALFSYVSMWLGLAFEGLPARVREHRLLARVRARLNREMTYAAAKLAKRFDGALYATTPDRLVLETTILPHFQLCPSTQHIIFVGCDWYTAGYSRLFAHKTFQTIDFDPQRATFGARRHIVGAMQELPAHVSLASQDLVICNGVVGFGLNDATAADAAFAAVFDVLRPGGSLLLGFNDKPPHNPFDLSQVASLARFGPVDLPALGVHEFRVPHELCHVYRLYLKPLH
jgi:SAM-dependent methyltransferase